MKVLIIEDETSAANTLQHVLAAYDDNIEMVAVTQSVSRSVEWLGQHKEEIDLLFMDIQLSDGLSFRIFEQVAINKPIIFTTASDEFAIQAFRVNSIDYLLKPINLKDLQRTMQKLAFLQQQRAQTVDYQSIFRQLQIKATAYKSRFLVKSGKMLQGIDVAEGNVVLLKTFQNNTFPVAYSLHKLEDQLDPQLFYRVSCNLIIQVKAIFKLIAFSKGRLKLALIPPFPTSIIVSHQKAVGLKEWLDR
jgi:DNA-binding LytR/AlgR family response regulator